LEAPEEIPPVVVEVEHMIWSLLKEPQEQQLVGMAENHGWESRVFLLEYTLWLFNIAMENGPFIDGLPGFTY